MAAYVSLAPAAAWTAVDGIARHDKPIRFVWNACLVTLGIMIVGTPVAGWLVAREETPALLGRLEPITAFVDNSAELGERLREETGLEPLYIAVHYGRASQLA